MKEFKVRCSGIGSIMTNAKGKSNKALYEEAVTTLKDSEVRYEAMKTKDGVNGVKLLDKINKLKADIPDLEKVKDVVELSTTTKSFVDEWVKQEIYERRNQFSNKYVEKGLFVEDESIEYLSETSPEYFLLGKNEDYFQDDFMTGTPDIILPDYIIDVKNSFSCFTFPLFEDEVPSDGYFYQAQGYMNLVGRDSYKLIYLLMSTPDHIIEKDFNYANKNLKMEDQMAFEDFRQPYLYDTTADKYRIKVFDIKRDDEVIQKIKDRVAECREYIQTLKF